MTALIPFAFDEHLVRAVMRDDEPWFVGKDVCAVLGLRNHNDALGSLDEDEKGVASTDPLALGGEQFMVIISEPGVYRLVFRSRKPEADPFKRWLAHSVLPQLRRTGRYALDAGQRGEPVADAAPRDWPIIQKIQVVQLSNRIHGRRVAAKLWRDLGLPDVPPPPPTVVDEARIALRHVLDHAAWEDGPRVRDLIARALDDDEEARVSLVACGIRVMPEREAFMIANRHPWLTHALKGTEWAAPLAFMHLARRLPGAVSAAAQRFGPVLTRGTLFEGHLAYENA